MKALAVLATLVISLTAPAAADHGWTGSSCDVEDTVDACAASDDACDLLLAQGWCRGVGAVRNATVNVTNAVLHDEEPEPSVQGVVDAFFFAADAFCRAVLADGVCDQLADA